jgi:hypothetical protein
LFGILKEFFFSKNNYNINFKSMVKPKNTTLSLNVTDNDRCLIKAKEQHSSINSTLSNKV